MTAAAWPSRSRCRQGSSASRRGNDHSRKPDALAEAFGMVIDDGLVNHLAHICMPASTVTSSTRRRPCAEQNARPTGAGQVPRSIEPEAARHDPDGHQPHRRDRDPAASRRATRLARTGRPRTERRATSPTTRSRTRTWPAKPGPSARRCSHARDSSSDCRRSPSEKVPEDIDPATVEAPGRYHRERGSAGDGALTAGAGRKHAPSGTRNPHAPSEACRTTADRRRAEHTS